MRSLSEAKARWQETQKYTANVADLQRAVKFNGPSSPCLTGCRSVCWKVFLLFQDTTAVSWPHILLELRTTYSVLRDKYLKFIKHPEQLAQLSFDPLADDPDSPWDAVRQDELVRAEILQDVQRLPDEPFYHEERIQTMILDILFLYCKLNPGDGGYRQGMHELLAPIVYIVAHDAIDRSGVGPDDLADSAMLEMLDAYFVEHDAYVLFAKIMDRAKAFYEVSEDDGLGSGEQSAIVARSKHIHEVVLTRVDAELAGHLRSIEVLPQIFLIRWIRLLFGREFPFEQLLVLWDTMFAFDPNLELIDLICVAMLIRIRWTLLEADYSVALQLLLKYPAPQAPHGPHTFVDDAVYLRDHLNAAGGAALVLKYTGRTPAATSASSSSHPSTPTTFTGFSSLRQRALGARSPLSSSARLLQQSGGVEALFQGAAKGMMERGEKLGISQAVRDAMGEIRRNVQGFQDNNTRSGSLRGDRGTSDQSFAVALMERRNRQLAAMLDDTVSSLKALAASQLEGEKEVAKHVETIEIAAAKIQFVKIYLEDSSLGLPEGDLPSMDTLAISSPKESASPAVALDSTSVVTTSSAVEVATSSLSSSVSGHDETKTKAERPQQAGEGATDDGGDKMDMDQPEHDPRAEPQSRALDAAATTSAQPAAEAGQQQPPSKPASISQQRPQAPIPTRSSLAQSSFSWMLEPDVTMPPPPPPPSSSSLPSSRAASISLPGSRRQHHTGSGTAARERNAFLFGEVTADGDGERKPLATEIFGLQPLRKGAAAAGRSGNGS